MVNRDGRSTSFCTGELLSITRNPQPVATKQVRRGRVDVGLVVPPHVDPNWFARTWYGEPRHSRGIGASILRLTVALKAMRIRLPTRKLRPVATRWQEQWR